MIIRLTGVLAIWGLSSCASDDVGSTYRLGEEELQQSGVRVEITGSSVQRSLARTVDKQRKANGFEPLIYDERIANLAQGHSDKLMKRYVSTGKTKLDHQGVKWRFNTIMLDYAMSKTAENVACCSKSPEPLNLLVTLWLRSEKHRVNMMQDWTHTGVGVSVAPDGSVFTTQIFSLKTDYTF